MAQITGYVKEIYEGTTKTGRSAGEPFWSITLDTDAKLTAFNLDFIRDVEEGKEYTFTIEASGKYVNITAPTVPCIRNDSETTSPDSTTAPPVDEPPPPKAGGYTKYSYKETEADYRERQSNIRKAVALKASVEYVASVLGGTGTVKDVLSYAVEFEEYLVGGKK